MVVFYIITNNSTKNNSNQSYEATSYNELSLEASYKSEDLNEIWDSAKTSYIYLEGDKITTENSNVSISDTIVTIKSGGTYSISGTLDDGQIRVQVSDSEQVHLILDGVNITCSNSSAIYVVNADKTIITLNENTINTLTDGTSYANTVEDEPNACLFSHDDLTINGIGILNINANYQDGIACKDDLVIISSTITVKATDDGIRGKDSITISEANITVDSKADCIKSTNDTDTSKGYIIIESGTFNLVATGNGDSSSKGIKAVQNITIEKGTFNINSIDDGIHSNNIIAIKDGDFTISTGDDGIHSDSKLTIDGGNINITKSYEGIESADITINGGIIKIVASDDGINAAGGVDSSGSSSNNGFGMGGPGQDMFSSSTGYLTITGGDIYINASGDGLDANGNITQTGGTVYVEGPTNGGNGALDYDGTFNIIGGDLIAVGASRDGASTK